MSILIHPFQTPIYIRHPWKAIDETQIKKKLFYSTQIYNIQNVYSDDDDDDHNEESE